MAAGPDGRVDTVKARAGSRGVLKTPLPISMHRKSSTSHVCAALALALSSGTSRAMYSGTSLPVKVQLKKRVRVVLGIVTKILASNVGHIGSELSSLGRASERVNRLPPVHALRKAEGNQDVE
jgi:hypothetical protein